MTPRRGALVAPLLLLALLAPVAAALDPDPDFTVRLARDAPPAYEGPEGLLTLVSHVPGERISWNVTSDEDYVVGHFVVEGAFDVARGRQIVPMIDVPGTPYPLFTWVPRMDLRDVDAPVRITNVTGADGRYVVRVGIPGPVDATLTLLRDVRPPAFTLGEIANLTHFGFYQETRTDELALADLRIRRADGQDEVQNPTPVYHFLQRFPVQGLDPSTAYVARVVFTDWAGNENASAPYSVTTPARPEAPPPIVTILSPSPNATIPAGSPVVIAAAIETPGAPLEEGGTIRFFLDKQEVRENMRFQNGTFQYAPAHALAPGPHSASLEVRTPEGGEAVVSWRFDVASAESPFPAPLLPLALAALLGLVARRR